MSEVFIQTYDLSKVYDGHTIALDHINVSINKGEWTSLIGPSGAGKTTLLNLIGCLDQPTGGSITVNGEDITHLNQTQLTKFRRENIGLIFQKHYLIPYLTALENVMLAMYYHGKVDENKAIRALNNVGLDHRLEYKPSKLSGGEQQRVCIARALINKPSLLIADEPTGNLDQKNGQLVMDLIHHLHKEGNTILLVSHNINIANQGDRVIQIIDGKVSNGS
ncbi:MAG: ABC transporter ATP-binding protein [Candidatus Hodarchaeales archaeon]|jgi:putative ABC transport system ATP-binding protein